MYRYKSMLILFIILMYFLIASSAVAAAIPTHLFPQPEKSEQFGFRGNGSVNSNLQYVHTYDYSQNLPWTYHGFEIPVDPSKSYTWSLDIYISPDANIPNTGVTFVANGENGFSVAFEYDNTMKGTWQHFEHTMQPTTSTARLNLYPTTSHIPATTGHIQYRHIEFRQNGSAANLFPLAAKNDQFAVRGNGIFRSEPYASGMYKYNYAQNLPWTFHGFDFKLNSNESYIFSLDAYISPEANIPDTGTTFIANGEQGTSFTFQYDNTRKGTWQRFTQVIDPSSPLIRMLLYPTAHSTPATEGYILYKNVELRRVGANANMFPQPTKGEHFTVRGNGQLEYKAYKTFSYDYAQNLPWSFHGFNIAVDPSKHYTWRFDVYISPEANIPNTGVTFVANGENGFGVAFEYNNALKGTWQHFEHTMQPTTSTARLNLYPTTSHIPATTGFILFRNVEFKLLEGEEWSGNRGRGGVDYIYDAEGRLVAVYMHGSSIPLQQFEYDLNGSIKRERVIHQ